MPCVCKMCGCSNPRDCAEDYCEQHLLDELHREKAEKERTDCEEGQCSIT